MSRTAARALLRAGLAGVAAAIAPAFIAGPAQAAEVAAAAPMREVKIFVSHDGLYRFSGSDLQALGLDLGTLDTSRVNLLNRGRAIPLSIGTTGPDGVALPGTEFVFWGEFPMHGWEMDSVYTPSNAYRLVFDGAQPPLRYGKQVVAQTHSIESIQSAAPSRYTRTARLEENKILQFHQHFNGPRTDRAMWMRLAAPPRKGAKIPIGELPDLYPGGRPVRMRMQLWGSTELGVKPDHKWTFSLNDKLLGRAEWDGTTSFVFETDAIADAFNPHGVNTIEATNAFTDETIDAILLDWVEIDYDAVLRPMAGFFDATLQLSGTRIVQSHPGVSASGMRLFDLSAGAEVIGGLVQGAGAGGDVFHFASGAAGDSVRLAAANAMGFRRPDRMLLRQATDLRRIEKAPDYLVITTGGLAAAAEKLCEYRRTQGLTTLVADIEDIYDAYTGGLFQPLAIRMFVDDLLRKSADGKGSLKYLFLLGEASIDYKSVEGKSANTVPTFHSMDDPRLPDYQPLHAVDDYFAYGPEASKAAERPVDPKHTDTPKIAVGRLPVNSPAQVLAYLTKIKEYELEPVAAPRALLIGADGFLQFCDAFEKSSMAGWETKKVYAKPYPEVAGNVALQGDIVGYWNTGPNAVYFVGHGSGMQWRTGAYEPRDQTDLFSKKHIDKLTNKGAYPVAFASTCYSALFDATQFDSGVGVYLVQAPDKGAIALVAHVGKTAVPPSQTFIEKMVARLKEDGNETIGQAFRTTKSEPLGDIASIALIGDPALRTGSHF